MQGCVHLIRSVRWLCLQTWNRKAPQVVSHGSALRNRKLPWFNSIPPLVKELSMELYGDLCARCCDESEVLMKSETRCIRNTWCATDDLYTWCAEDDPYTWCATDDPYTWRATDDPCTWCAAGDRIVILHV